MYDEIMSETLSSTNEAPKEGPLEVAKRTAREALRGCRKMFRGACRDAGNAAKQSLNAMRGFYEKAKEYSSPALQATREVVDKRMVKFKKVWGNTKADALDFIRWSPYALVFTPARIAALLPRFYEMNRIDIWWNTTFGNKQLDRGKFLFDLNSKPRYTAKKQPSQQPQGGQPQQQP